MTTRKGTNRRLSALIAGVVALGVLGPVVSTPAHAETPPALAGHTSFDEALAAARSSGRPLVAVFTAKWCGPCRVMERSVWSDPGVIQWINQHAVGVLVDIEDDKRTSNTYDVRAVPATLVFVDGQFQDRTNGLRSAESMIGWLSRFAGGASGSGAVQTDPTPVRVEPTQSAPGATLGESRIVSAPTAPRVVDPAPPHELEVIDLTPKPDGRAFMAQARAALKSGREGAAAQNFVQAWSAYAAGSWSRSRAELALRELCASQTGRLAVLSERDRATQGSEPWWMLSDVLEDRASILRQLERSPSSIESSSESAAAALLGAGRGEIASRLVHDPQAFAARRHTALVSKTPGQAKAGLSRFREEMGRLYAALHAGGRASEGEALASRVMKLDDTPWTRIVIARRAIDGGFATPAHARLLDEAAQAGAKVDELKARFNSTRGGQVAGETR